MHDIQPQSYTGFIHTARFIAFIKPFKQMWQLLCRQTAAGIAHRETGAVGLAAQMNTDRTALIHKLDRVIQQVLHHLPQQVEIALQR